MGDIGLRSSMVSVLWSRDVPNSAPRAFDEYPLEKISRELKSKWLFMRGCAVGRRRCVGVAIIS